MKQLRVGIIGVQGFGRRHAEILSGIPGALVQTASGDHDAGKEKRAPRLRHPEEGRSGKRLAS